MADKVDIHKEVTDKINEFNKSSASVVLDGESEPRSFATFHPATVMLLKDLMAMGAMAPKVAIKARDVKENVESVAHKVTSLAEGTPLPPFLLADTPGQIRRIAEGCDALAVMWDAKGPEVMANTDEVNSILTKHAEATVTQVTTGSSRQAMLKILFKDEQPKPPTLESQDPVARESELAGMKQQGQQIMVDMFKESSHKHLKGASAALRRMAQGYRDFAQGFERDVSPTINRLRAGGFPGAGGGRGGR